MDFAWVISLMRCENVASFLVGENLDGLGCDKRKYKVLRAKAIHKLITEVKQVFLDYDELLSGDFDSPLTAKSNLEIS